VSLLDCGMGRQGASILASLGLALALEMACSSDDELPEGHFPCGMHGGSCDASTEACVVLDGCSTCIDLPPSCDEATCECVSAAMDADPTLSSCIDNGSCALEEDGVSASCTEADPSFGCG